MVVVGGCKATQTTAGPRGCGEQGLKNREGILTAGRGTTTTRTPHPRVRWRQSD